MSKKLLALIMTGPCIAPAFAQGGNVTIYGTLNGDFENVERDHAAAAGTPRNSLVASPTAANASNVSSRNRFSSNSSNIGFRGSEDLGIAGLKAIFQCESAVDTLIDSRQTLGASGGQISNTFCSRNSNIGLTGPWGALFYGTWDTPYKVISLRQDGFYATSIAAGNAILGSPGFGVANATQGGRVGVAGVQATDPGSGLPIPGVFSTVAVSGAADATFDRRQGNSVQYWTPSWEGLSARIAYSANEQRSATNAVPNINPYIGSIAALYENGPFYIAFGYERHQDYFGLFGLTGAAASGTQATNGSSRDTGYKAGVGYTFFKTTTVNLVAERLEYENGQSLAGVLTQYSRDAFYVSLLHKIGPGTIRASFGKAQDGDCSVNGAACNTDGLGANAYALGYSYSLSKRTDVYALYSRINNDSLASYNFGFNPLAGAGAGSDLSGFGAGIRHSF